MYVVTKQIIHVHVVVEDFIFSYIAAEISFLGVFIMYIIYLLNYIEHVSYMYLYICICIFIIRYMYVPNNIFLSATSDLGILYTCNMCVVIVPYSRIACNL